TFSNFWFWTFTYASVYTSYQVPLRDGIENLYFAFHSVIGASPLAWKIALFGFAASFLFRKENERTWFIFFFFIASFISVLPGFYFREHYFVTLMPVIAIYIGFGLQRASEIFKRIDFTGKLKWLPGAVAVLLFVVAVSEKLRIENDYLFHRSANDISIHAYGPNPFVETKFLADSIAAHTTSKDQIAVIGSEPQVFFYSHRHSATGFIYFFPLMELQPYAEKMQQWMISDIEKNEPRYILYTGYGYLMRITPRSGRIIFEWLPKYLNLHYDLIGVVEVLPKDERSKTYWGVEAQTHIVQNLYCLQVYRKKIHEDGEKNK
ncbi:MAG: hypothetical protein PHP42_07370, partial [Bacteroidota bacterium]|nr:hypothetical protein [Bacteroidota bacterium]